ncbi:MAG TPA: non-heme iron oxygenase ferredoxin subunit [Bdellovibrionota bacterium]|nr:non-heme iron oxygenase ferredoxin subunit [Bdellovibrionota bacterium]
MSKTKVAKTTEIPIGQVKVVEIDGERVAICNVNGEFYAIQDVCTHDGGALGQGELMGEIIECPRHGAQFRVTDGKVVRLPAVVPLRTYKVVIEGMDIFVEVPEE